MRFQTSLLLPALAGAASALSDASVYLFQGSKQSATNPPTLSPEQARLVFAQRLGASQYHGLGDASDATLSYINDFGGQPEVLFQDAAKDTAAELLLIVEGVSMETAEPLLKAWSSIKPAFSISHPPSMAANAKLVLDLSRQSSAGKALAADCPFEEAINPFGRCWNGKTKIVHLDLGNTKDALRIEELMSAQERMIRFADKEEMNVAVVLMPESSRSSKSASNPYGSYEKVAQRPVANNKRQAEEPMTVAPAASPVLFNKQTQTSDESSNTARPIAGLPPLCHSSLDACESNTRNCSGHGSCYKKGACFTCGCSATNETFSYAEGTKRGYTLTYWGGTACQKQDYSGPFWLVAVASVVMVGLVGWAIGLIFSIGEEKLPGVIGAGVSSKTR